MKDSHITGTLIKNYFHCKRQAYLYYYGLNFHSEYTRIGELMHLEEGNKDITIDNIRLDDIKNGNIIEFKKTTSNLEGTKFQVLFYLETLYKKGLNLKGRIIDLSTKEAHVIELNSKSREELGIALNNINLMLQSDTVPARKEHKMECKNCSFRDYCLAE